MNVSKLKLEIFIPETHLSKLRLALQSIGAGKIGNYDSCLAYSRICSSFASIMTRPPPFGRGGHIAQDPHAARQLHLRWRWCPEPDACAA